MLLEFLVTLSQLVRLLLLVVVNIVFIVYGPVRIAAQYFSFRCLRFLLAFHVFEKIWVSTWPSFFEFFLSIAFIVVFAFLRAAALNWLLNFWPLAFVFLA